MVGLGEWVVGSVGWRWEGCERRVRREGPVEKKMVAVLMQGRLVRGAERGEGRWVSNMCGDGEASVEKGRLVLQLAGEKNQNQGGQLFGLFILIKGKGRSTENG